MPKTRCTSFACSFFYICTFICCCFVLFFLVPYKLNHNWVLHIYTLVLLLTAGCVVSNMNELRYLGFRAVNVEHCTFCVKCHRLSLSNWFGRRNLCSKSNCVKLREHFKDSYFQLWCSLIRLEDVRKWNDLHVRFYFPALMIHKI